jgi:dolichyl-phosphate beta-glucosyltransferase
MLSEHDPPGSISIIIAAFNEEKRIIASLLKIKEYVHKQNIPYEIIVVDDGSTDSTYAVVTDLIKDIQHLKVIHYSPNKGKGHALRTGVLASRGEIILLSDADLSTPIEELSKLLLLIYNHNYDIAIGSRALALSEIVKKQPWWRQSMGKFFNKLVKVLVIEDFKDTQCGFKVFRGDIARSLFKEAQIDRFAYDVEILAIGKKKGYKIVEAPVRWINSPESKVNPVTDSLQMFGDLLRIRLTIGKAKNKQPS